MKFSLQCRVELSEKERDLVDRYRVADHVLTWREQGDRQVPGLTIQDIVRGTAQEVDEVTTLLSNEEVIKSACQEFKTLLEVMATFGGEEIIEY